MSQTKPGPSVAPQTPRRHFLQRSLQTSLLWPTLGSASFGLWATAAQAESQAAPQALGVTRQVARYVVQARYEDLPQAVRHEGVRSLMNWVGVAVGGSRHETVDRALKALLPFSTTPQASVLGRTERLDVMKTAFINGVSSHIFDFDDTHLKTIIHPAGPVASSALALAEYLGVLRGQPVSGAELLNALVLGMDIECRIGNAVYPNHYDVGWHITGTTGPFGSAVAAGKLLGLSEQQMVWALGLAASQPVGLRESFGSMNKSFNPGRAAENGLFAAILASQNFTSSDGMLEAKRGWGNTISTKQDWREVTEGLGRRYESALNTYKPYACGIVIHPAIEAAIRLRQPEQIQPEDIARIDLQVHPLVIELTNKKTPQRGLEGKFSVYHSVAVAWIEGAAGERQYSDRAVRDPRIVALRDKVRAVINPQIKADQVDMTVTLKDGRQLHQFIDRAIGSVEVPMSQTQLEAKFSDLATDILPKAQTRELMDLCWQLERLPDVCAITRLARPLNTGPG